MIGFPSYQEYRENQKNNLHSYSSSYRPIYEMCNRYLSNGHSVLYGAESIPNKSAEEKVFEKIPNKSAEEKVFENILFLILF
jgi:hypothetical protein